MFCPKCKAEYRPGFNTCSDCGVALVHELPKEPDPHREQEMRNAYGRRVDLSAFVEIRSTTDPGEIAFIKSVLDAEGVEYYLKGEHADLMYYVEAVRLMVRRDQAEAAAQMLEDVDLSEEAERAYEQGEEGE